jgi:DNA-directed RNA polymerase subunit F
MDQYLSLAEVRELLKRERKERGSLSPEQTYALHQAETFARLTADEVGKKQAIVAKDGRTG